MAINIVGTGGPFGQVPRHIEGVLWVQCNSPSAPLQNVSLIGLTAIAPIIVST